MARTDARDPLAAEPPRILRPMLGFAHLPEPALERVREALDDDAFRLRVAEKVDTSALSEGSRLLLERPDGWADALDVLIEESVGNADSETHSERVAELTARAEEAEAAVAGHVRRHSELSRRLEEAEAQLQDREGSIAALRTRVSELEADLEGRRADHAETIRQLTEAKGLAERRLSELRELRASAAEQKHTVESQQTPGDTQRGAPERARLAGSLAEAARTVGELRTLLGDLGQELGIDVVEPTDAPRGSGPGARRRATGSRSAPGPGSRRRAPGPGRGLVLDSPEGLSEMLNRAGLLVLVDGYNVSMEGWPAQNIADQRRSLISVLGHLQTRSAAEIQVVFDGAFAGERPVVDAPLPVRVHFTQAGLEADDRLLEFVESAAPDLGILVVSSDRRVRDGARDRGAGVVSSRTLLALRR